MWLLNTKTFKLEEFYSDVPAYAILSHRWKKDEEVSFGGLKEPHPYSDRSGYKKIKDCCKKARERRLAWIWVDTCCIDKKSSAELSEAINSMYIYYSRAKVCYVYLYDVTSLENFDQSSWFTRGWTLQELLAPAKMHFFNHVWKPIGSRRSLASRIEKITGIDGKALQDLNLANYCVAEKFSWSAKRQTTREEDRAYCLLGLFQINMPLLYGEGTRAFRRLQEEIMKTSTDASIFLWQGPAVDSFGMLASDPSCFSGLPEYTGNMIGGNIARLSMDQGWSLTNTGIDMVVRMKPYLLTRKLEYIYALEVHNPWTLILDPDVIFVKLHRSRSGVTTVTRVSVDGITWMSRTTIPVNHPGDDTEKVKILRQPLQEIHTLAYESREFVVRFVAEAPVTCAAYQRPCSKPNAKLRLWQEIRNKNGRSLDFSVPVDPKAATGVLGYLLLTLVDDVQILICLCASRDFQPLCIALPFCKQLLDKGFKGMSILREYERVSEGQEFEVNFFDTRIHMLGFSEDDGVEPNVDIGLYASLYSSTFSGGKLEARIEFNISKFIRYYIPTADRLTYGSTDCISHGFLLDMTMHRTMNK
jgi:hypothetical protein